MKTLLAALALLAVIWFAVFAPKKENKVIDNVSENPSKLVSAIQPVSQASAASASVGTASGSLRLSSRAKLDPLTVDDMENLRRRFDEANQAIENGQLQSATEGLESLTSDFPSIVEPYLNLASIYAEQQQLEKARATLMKGFEANPKAGMLFDHLKKVHGALAASSYRQALDTKSADSTINSLKLARASTIVTQLDQSNRIAALQQQLQDSQSEADASVNQLQSQEVAALEAKLKEVEASNLVAKSSYENELNDLKQQITEQSQALSLSQTAEREALARVVRAEQDASNKIAEMARELEAQKTSLLAAQTLASEQSVALEQAQQQGLQQSQALALKDAQNAQLIEQASSQASTSIKPEKVPDANKLALEQTATNLVQSWARSWSAQDVSAYVSHYAEDYSSSRSITRAQWLEQRQVRLTNKKFINVEVTDFKIKDLGAQFSVTFSQYYKSNTVDDTVTKRLIFDKDNDDWSNSKIVNERLVAN